LITLEKSVWYKQQSIAILSKVTKYWVVNRFIKGTRTLVRAIVEMWRIGVSPEEITQRLPHLGLSQVFDALSYYLNHQAEIDEYVERDRIPDELIDPRVRNL